MPMHACTPYLSELLVDVNGYPGLRADKLCRPADRHSKVIGL
jgi:hypothetical protein